MQEIIKLQNFIIVHREGITETGIFILQAVDTILNDLDNIRKTRDLDSMRFSLDEARHDLYNLRQKHPEDNHLDEAQDKLGLVCRVLGQESC